MIKESNTLSSRPIKNRLQTNANDIDHNNDNDNNNNIDKNNSNNNSNNNKTKSYIQIGAILILFSLFFYPLILYLDLSFVFSGGVGVDVTANSIQTGLKKIAHWSKNNGNCGNHRVAVGYNTNLDLVVNAVDLLHALGLSPTQNPTPSDEIHTLSQFEQTFTYYFDSGSAAERFITEKDVFDQIIKATDSLNRQEYLTGGNAGIIANRLAREGCRVDLSGVVGSKLKNLLNDSINVIEYNADTRDEIHLIMEYQTNSTWGAYSTHRANRFIVSNDVSNANIVTMEQLHRHLQQNSKQHKTDLLIISGLHLLGDQQLHRIEEMSKLLDIIPYQSGKESLLSVSNIPIHFELASITSSNIIGAIAKSILPKVDSLGFNEQELGFLYLATGGTEHTMSEFRAPSINTVINAIIHVFKHITKSSGQDDPMSMMLDDKRKLTRIHFHYLTYHIVAIQKESSWSTKSAIMSVAASSIEASEQACGFRDVELRIPLKFEVDYRYTPGSKLKFAIDETFPITSWQDEGLEFHLAPVLVCKSPERTVGLGDSISTTGFIYQTIKN
ncbi:glucokinase [Heterostelium album PN500]|uniref:Glucokinase n=1 Tax=Heterostelium pallidum (strain ATCC 26659 / Pp 5 / PN500) TaxID=670386 RepID=D3B0L6_HETP5|nr:glucokinase [Heterostelium album PN500]EFA84840.1 glucokinase [Heterostelium album PN500]|eukprot:XP_020436951.1 glucokinase [Heterostelium album PN500]